MKVGTDGTLLGVWAHGGDCILDIGTGTGLVALMMAQRFPLAEVTGIDIDSDACIQARENVEASPFTISILHGDVADLKGEYDCIVSNPPYFCDSLECPDEQRTTARHASALSYRKLMESSWQLLSDEGEMSLIIPVEYQSRLESEAALVGFFKVRECFVRTTLRKAPKRVLMAFRKHPTTFVKEDDGIIETAPNVRSSWYHELTKDFYL